MEVVCEPSVLEGTEAAHIQDYLLSRRYSPRHRTQIYSPRDLLCLDENFIPNKSKSRTVEEKKGPDPQRYYLVITV